jgi:uncharacterized protein (DUF302 family)
MKPVKTKVTRATVAHTLAHLIAEVEARGMKLFTTIDHSAEARARGLELRETKLVIFGDPKSGTRMMQAAPLAALDLPLKVLVFTDGDRTCVSYSKPSELAARYQLGDELATGFTGVNALTDAVIYRLTRDASH